MKRRSKTPGCALAAPPRRRRLSSHRHRSAACASYYRRLLSGLPPRAAWAAVQALRRSALSHLSTLSFFSFLLVSFLISIFSFLIRFFLFFFFLFLFISFFSLSSSWSACRSGLASPPACCLSCRPCLASPPHAVPELLPRPRVTAAYCRPNPLPVPRSGPEAAGYTQSSRAPPRPPPPHAYTLPVCRARGFSSSDTKYKLINTRRGRAYGSRARAEGMDMIPR